MEGSDRRRTRAHTLSRRSNTPTLKMAATPLTLLTTSTTQPKHTAVPRAGAGSPLAGGHLEEISMIKAAAEGGHQAGARRWKSPKLCRARALASILGDRL